MIPGIQLPFHPDYHGTQITVEERPFKGRVKAEAENRGFSPRVPFSLRIPRRHPDYFNEPGSRTKHQPHDADPVLM
jgi:hypothetical protein